MTSNVWQAFFYSSSRPPLVERKLVGLCRCILMFNVRAQCQDCTRWKSERLMLLLGPRAHYLCMFLYMHA